MKVCDVSVNKKKGQRPWTKVNIGGDWWNKTGNNIFIIEKKLVQMNTKWKKKK